MSQHGHQGVSQNPAVMNTMHPMNQPSSNLPPTNLNTTSNLGPPSNPPPPHQVVPPPTFNPPAMPPPTSPSFSAHSPLLSRNNFSNDNRKSPPPAVSEEEKLKTARIRKKLGVQSFASGLTPDVVKEYSLTEEASKILRKMGYEAPNGIPNDYFPESVRMWLCDSFSTFWNLIFLSSICTPIKVIIYF